MADTRSLYEQMESAVCDLGALVEALAAEVYRAVEADELKRLAVLAGVDHTQEGTVVLSDIGAVLVRERDVNRELRRRIVALNRSIEGRRPMTDEQTDRDERKAEVLASLSLQNRIDAAVAAEREACRQIVNDWPVTNVTGPASAAAMLGQIAAAIRNRGEATDE